MFMSFRITSPFFRIVWSVFVILFSLVSTVVQNVLLAASLLILDFLTVRVVAKEKHGWVLPKKNTAAFWCNFPTSKVIHAAYEYKSALRAIFLQYVGVLSTQIPRGNFFERNPLGKWGQRVFETNSTFFCIASTQGFLRCSSSIPTTWHIHFEMFCLQPEKGSDTSRFQADLLTEPWSTTWTAHSSSSSCQRSWCERTPERTRTRVRALLKDSQLARTGQWRILLL